MVKKFIFNYRLQLVFDTLVTFKCYSHFSHDFTIKAGHTRREMWTSRRVCVYNNHVFLPVTWKLGQKAGELATKGSVMPISK